MWNFFFFFVKYNESNKKRNAKNGDEIDLLKKGEIRERSKGEERLSVSGDRRNLVTKSFAR